MRTAAGFSCNEHELDVTTNKPYIVSALLDPRFKGKFMSVKSLSDGRVMLLKDLRLHCQNLMTSKLMIRSVPRKMTLNLGKNNEM